MTRTRLTEPPTVLALYAEQGVWEMRTGIQMVAHEFGWRLQTVEYSRRRTSRYGFVRSSVGETVADLLEFWHPDGCIVQSLTPPVGFRPEDFPGIPVVFVDRHPGTLPAGTPCVCCDPQSVAGAAARELLRPGVDNLAFVPWYRDESWSRERGEAFAEIAAMNGKRLHVFRHPAGNAAEHRLAAHLGPWIASLPRPCGVFAANDMIADGVLVACGRAGVEVPEEVAVVSVDDNYTICEATSPTLSSIRLDHIGAGRAAAEMLASRMAGDAADTRSRADTTRTFGVLRLVRRASSRPVSDRRVARALEDIRLHACEETFGPRDVLRTMGLSRAYAFTLFRETTGRTVLDEIHAVRLARARELLASGMAPDAVGFECGYASHADFRRVFRHRVGKTIRQWILAQTRGR